jgi:hypothetical protein
LAMSSLAWSLNILAPRGLESSAGGDTYAPLPRTPPENDGRRGESGPGARPGGVEGSAARHFRARHSPDRLTRLFSLLAPCFSLLSPLFSLLRGRSDLENPQKTFCFQSVGRTAPLRAEQERNREIIRGIREVTGR